MPFSLPAKLYKFYEFSSQSLKNLKKQIIYFGSPRNFNDPYDCTLEIGIQDLSSQEVEELRRFYLAGKLPDAIRIQFESLPAEFLKQLLLSSFNFMLKKERTEFLAHRGVGCFSETVNNLLLWAHYAEKYKGFCLEFDTNSFGAENLKFRQVDYVETPPLLDSATIVLSKNWDSVLQKLFCTKSNAWAYEKEWRAIHSVAGTEWTYPKKSLTGVYFGPEMDRASQEIICLILAGQNSDVQFWQGRREATRFSVEFEKVTYTPFIKRDQPQAG